jgi:hypothetical protein
MASVAGDEDPRRSIAMRRRRCYLPVASDLERFFVARPLQRAQRRDDTAFVAKRIGITEPAFIVSNQRVRVCREDGKGPDPLTLVGSFQFSQTLLRLRPSTRKKPSTGTPLETWAAFEPSRTWR